MIQKILTVRFYKVAFTFILVGILLIAISVLAMTKVKDVDSFSETQAEITSIDEEEILDGSDSSSYEYTVKVKYMVNGVEYTDIDYGSYSSSMKVGDSVTVLYNPENPADIQAPGADKVPYIVLAGGIIAMLAGVVFVVKGRKGTKASLIVNG